jgi:hypothetical protein
LLHSSTHRAYDSTGGRSLSGIPCDSANSRTACSPPTCAASPTPTRFLGIFGGCFLLGGLLFRGFLRSHRTLGVDTGLLLRAGIAIAFVFELLIMALTVLSKDKNAYVL